MFRSKELIFSSIAPAVADPTAAAGSLFSTVPILLQYPELFQYSELLHASTSQQYHQQQHSIITDRPLSTPLILGQRPPNTLPNLTTSLSAPDSRTPQDDDDPMTPSTSRFSPTMKGRRCVGCGSESSIRVHYGAASCHGCKAFFRRSVFEGRVYMCSGENHCDITNESRNRCRSCRLRNCLDGGMNPKHVREERCKTEKSPSMELQPSEREVSADTRQMDEHQLTLFVCALEKQTEVLTDEDVHSDGTGKWSRDISLTFGLQNPQLVIRRTTIDWDCGRIMQSTDLYSSWYRAFVLHADWAMSIPEFRMLSLPDQTSLFKQNFSVFGWMTYAYKAYRNGQQTKGIPLGNGSFIPYGEEEKKHLEPRYQESYGVVCKKLIELTVLPMTELEISEEEYCLLKTIALFQMDCVLTESGIASCSRVRDRLLEALSIHIERRFPYMSSAQRSVRALRLSMLLPTFNYISQVELSVMQQHLNATDMDQLSGVPMELVNSCNPTNMR